MRLRPAALALLLLASSAWLVSCGDPSGSSDPVAYEGAPLWRAAIENLPAAGQALSLHARSPCRVRFRMEGTGRSSNAGAWRRLATGQTIRVIWSHVVEAVGEGKDHPPAQMAAEGRTEAHGVRLNFQFEDDGVVYQRPLFWTRPGKGKVHAAEAVPPGKYEPLPREGSLELLTLLAADLGRGTAALRGAGPSVRIVWRPEDPADARYDELRLFLDLAP